jgi:integrase
MSIYFECDKCLRRNSLKAALCSCGEKFIPQGAIYWIEVRDNTGKKIRRKLGRVALSTARQAEAELKILATTERRVDDFSWKDLVKRFCAKIEAEGRCRQYCVDSYRLLNEMGDFWGRDKKVSEITPALFKEFRIYLLNKKTRRGTKLAKNTIDRYHSAAKACWKYTVEDKPCPFSRIPLFRPDDGDVGFLTVDKAETLLSIARQVDTTCFQMLAVALATGLRKMNVVLLKREEVDLNSGIICVTQKRKRRHVVLVGDQTLEMLNSIPDNGSEFFWINHQTGNPYDTFPRRKWEKIKRLSGIDDSFQFHGLRHTAAATIYQITGDLKAVKDILGHTNFNTSNRYTHVLTEHFRSIADRMDPLRKVLE